MFGSPVKMFGSPMKMFGSKDGREIHGDARESREDVRESREDFRESREDFRESRENVRDPHEGGRSPVKMFRSPMKKPRPFVIFSLLGHKRVGCLRRGVRGEANLIDLSKTRSNKKRRNHLFRRRAYELPGTKTNQKRPDMQGGGNRNEVGFIGLAICATNFGCLTNALVSYGSSSSVS